MFGGRKYVFGGVGEVLPHVAHLLGELLVVGDLLRGADLRRVMNERGSDL